MELGAEKWKRLIINGAKALYIDIDLKKADQFAIHAVELIKWNRKINLTSITDPLEIAVKHFVDSIVPAPIIPPGARMLDIGSGGGFPGIPIKILIPSLPVTLIDASRKKVNFLKHVVRNLNLENVDVRQVRAGDLVRDRSYDVIISRALSSLEAFVSMALPLLAEGGSIIALRGMVAEGETDSVRSLTLKYLTRAGAGQTPFSLDLKTYMLPFLGSARSMIHLKLGP
jgi:16S rRNA (guanine527-N7)-methyltransferase